MRQEPGRRQLQRETVVDVAGQHAEHDAAVAGQGRDQLADARQKLDFVGRDLAAQHLDIARAARRQAVASDRLGRAPAGGQLDDDRRVGAPVKTVAVEFAAHAVGVGDRPKDGAPTGAMSIDQGAVDVEQDEAVRRHSPPACPSGQ